MMSVLLNYVAVILIWSTTPLAIKVSSTSVSPFAAILYRMVIAFFWLPPSLQYGKILPYSSVRTGGFTSPQG